jgi:transcriptional regulator with XRE-family HTH domain
MAEEREKDIERGARIRERIDALDHPSVEAALARIAEELGVSPRTVGNWRAGHVVPKTKRRQLAAALRTSTGYLLGETDDPSPPAGQDIEERLAAVETRMVDLATDETLSDCFATLAARITEVRGDLETQAATLSDLLLEMRALRQQVAGAALPGTAGSSKRTPDATPDRRDRSNG